MTYMHTEAELIEFEKTWNIKLPSAYRNHLLTLGGGGERHTVVDALEDWDYSPEELPSNHLSNDFPHIEAWNNTELLDPQLVWHSEYFNPKFKAGSIPIKETGCEGKDLLVISGPEIGNIWHDDRACTQTGIYPLENKDGRRITIEEYLTMKGKAT